MRARKIPRQFHMPTAAHTFAILAGVCVLASLLGLLCAPSRAVDGVPTATIDAHPDIVMADGRSKSVITVTVDDGTGHVVADGTQVQFRTTSGTLDPESTVTQAGVARTTLTSSPIAGTATITASFIAAGGGASASTSVEFTTDSSLADTDQVAANWIRVTSGDYLAYGADSRIVDSACVHHGVRIAFRGLEIDADAAQIDLDGDVVRAQRATMHHGAKPPLYLDALYYNLDQQQGTGMIANAPGRHTVEQVEINGLTLQAKEIAPGSLSRPVDYSFRDLSDGHVLVKAASVSVQPHSQIQMARATIYMDGKKIVSMPNQVMPLSTDQAFGQKILGFGSNGLFLDVPYYASLSPSGTGLFSVRSVAASEEAGTYYPGRNAFAVDYNRSFNSSSRQSDLRLVGVSTPNWGLSWSQSQRLNGGTQTYLYVDAPEHQSFYGSGNVRHDYGPFSLDLQQTESQPIATGYGSYARSSSADAQTPAHVLIGGGKGKGLFYSEDATYTTSNSIYKFSNTSFSSDSLSESYGLRLNTNPVFPDKRTSITDSLSIVQTDSPTAHFDALNMTGNMQMVSQLSRTVSTNLGYRWTHAPQLGGQIAVVKGTTLLGLENATDRSNFSLGLGASAPDRRWDMSLNSTYGLPTEDMSTGGTFFYRLSSQMHFEVDNYYSRTAGFGYSDIEYSIGHRLGGRDLVISWDSMARAWRFNLTQAQY
jgi:hypothetical protein